MPTTRQVEALFEGGEPIDKCWASLSPERWETAYSVCDGAATAPLGLCKRHAEAILPRTTAAVASRRTV